MNYASPFLYLASGVIALFTLTCWVKWKRTDKPVYKPLVLGGVVCSLVVTGLCFRSGQSEAEALRERNRQVQRKRDAERMTCLGRYINEQYGTTRVAVIVNQQVTELEGFQLALGTLERTLQPGTRVDVVDLDASMELLLLDPLMAHDPHDSSSYNAEFDRIVASTQAEVILDWSCLSLFCQLELTGCWQLPEDERPDVIIEATAVDPQMLMDRLERGHLQAAVVTYTALDPETQFPEPEYRMATAENIEEVRRWVERMEIF